MPGKPQIERKLAAIMFTDIAGYTALSAKDSTKASELLKTQRDTLKPIVEKHGGSWMKEIGDGLLIIFDSATSAVECSIAIQVATKDIEDLNLRIGIHEGEVIKQDGDVIGDDVNVTSRIEPFSAVGGVAISHKIEQAISSNQEFEASHVGKPELKGVAQKVEVYCITSHGLPETDISKVSAKLEEEEVKPRFNVFALTGGILTAIGIAFWIAVGVFDVSFGGKAEVPSIGILMMENRGAEEDEVWARGITEDLIVKIAGAGLIRVSPMKEILEVDNKQNIKEIAKKLQVKYILTSSLFKKEDNFDLRCQLIEAESGVSKYGNKWSESLENASTIVDNLAKNILKKMKGFSTQEIATTSTINSEAYEFYLKGKYKYSKSQNIEDIEIARGLLEKAIELDKNLIIAKNILGNIIFDMGDSHGALEIYNEALKQSERFGDKRNTVISQNNIGNLLWRKGDYDEALVYYLNSLQISKEINDNNGITYSLRACGSVFYAKGNYDKQFEYLEKSYELHEKLDNKRGMKNYYGSMSLNFNKMGNYTKALEFKQLYMNMSKELKSYSSISNALHISGMIYVLQGKYYEAINVLEECLRMKKELSSLYYLETNTLLALSKKNLHQNYDVTEIATMTKDAQSETVWAGSRFMGIDFDLNLWLYQLLEDKSYIDSAYNQIQKLADNLEPDVAAKFLSYPIPKTIVEEWEKVQ